MKQSLHQSESGVASIVVSMIIMIVLTLTTIGFARLMSREYRQAIDNQLSVQAFYAAEAAANRVVAETAAGLSPASTDCETPDGNYVLESGVVQATCVLINENNTGLSYSNSDERNSTVFKLKTASGDNVREVEFSWTASGGSVAVHAIPGSRNLLSYREWSDAGNMNILRVNFVPFVAGMNVNDLADKDRTYFMFPAAAAGPVVNAANQTTNGETVNAACVTGGAGSPTRCTARINVNGLSANQYYFRVKGIYAPASFDVRAYTNAGGSNPVALDDGQLTIDVTGQANDVLRRIRLTVDMDSQSTLIPEYGIETSHSICKRLLVSQVPALTTDECSALY